jgi:hypothetical protein
LEELYHYSLSSICVFRIDRFGTAIERDLNDLETTFVAPTHKFVQSLPEEYQDMARLPSTTNGTLYLFSKTVDDDGKQRQREKEHTKKQRQML